MEKLDAILRNYTAQGEDTKDKLLGAAFVVTSKDDGVIYSGSAGRLSQSTTPDPFTPQSFTWVASLTKLPTSVCVMQLVERGLVDLDADLRPIVPHLRDVKILQEFDDEDNAVFEENTRPITMRQLLTHTAGFGYEFVDPLLLKWARTQPGRNPSRLEWSRQEISTPLRFEPGEGWGYGVNIDWAGQALEAISGKTLGQYMQENIFDPLGMKDSGFWPERLPQTASRTAQNVQRTKTATLREAYHPTPKDHEIESGGGGLFCTAEDYSRFLRGFLQGRLLNQESMNEMRRPQLNEEQAQFLEFVAYHPLAHDGFAPEFRKGQKLNHGLGGLLNLDDVPGKRKRRSIAWSGILNSRWWADPESGIAAVLIVNVRPQGDPVVAKLYNELELAVYGELLGQSVPKSRI